MSESFDFGAPELFTTGAVGPPGQRTFYLQARQGGVLATLKVEKEHVNALAEYLSRLLEARPAAALSGDLALVEPVAPAWAVGSLGVGYDEAADRIAIEAEELLEEGSEVEAATARIRVTRPQAQAYVERGRSLIKAGRPPCPICGRPVNQTGHVCPRSNGHTRD